MMTITFYSKPIKTPNSLRDQNLEYQGSVVSNITLDGQYLLTLIVSEMIISCKLQRWGEFKMLSDRWETL